MRDLSITAIKSNTQLALQNRSFSLKDDKIIQDDFKTRLKKRFNFSYSKNEALKIVNYVLEKIQLSLSNQEMKRPIILLGNRVIKLFAKTSSIKKALLILDRSLSQIKLTHSFVLKENKQLFEKWKSYGFQDDLFYKYPNFSDFMLRSTLASQMKITSDGIKIIDNEPAILVDGNWTKSSIIEKRFSYKYSSHYREIFIYEKKTNEVFSYLPNSKGLQKFHPYLNAFDPVAKLTDDEYKTVLSQAQKFEREYKSEKQEYRNVLQIVTSKEFDKSNVFKNSNFAEFTKFQHPYIRLIDAESKKVYVMGYNLGFKARLNILKTFFGKFRSLDIWEYKRCEQKIVTNIALTDKEKDRFFTFCKKFINDDINFGRKIAFHYLKQNCTSFVKNAIEYSLKEKIVTDLYIHDLIYYIAPNILRNLASFIKNSVVSIKNKSFRVFPKGIKNKLNFLIGKIQEVFNSAIAFFLSIIASFLGAFSGREARRLKNPDSNQKFHPPLTHLFNWFNYSNYKIDLPSKLVFWQLKQKSTKSFDKPKLLEIV